MDEHAWLAQRFEENRGHLRVVAQRLLGSLTEAEDAVQEAWLRLSRADFRKLEDIAGWLTTVVARVCLDTLRARKTQAQAVEEQPTPALETLDAETELLLADSIGSALVVVLEALEPAERIAFVLHDLFDTPFDEVGRIVGRTSAAARQLASRARRRLRGGGASVDDDLASQRKVVSAFFAASRAGDFEALLAVLDPDIVLRADEASVQHAAANQWGENTPLLSEVRGAQAVAMTFRGRPLGVQRAVIDGMAGAIWVHAGQTRALWEFTIEDGRIVDLVLSMDPARLAQVSVVVE